MSRSQGGSQRGEVAAPRIETELVRGLIASQFPQWSDLPITEAKPQGWDNRTFRLGTQLSVRLPSAAGYCGQVVKEHRWLPALAPHLPLPVPIPVARGVPGSGYPFEWSVFGWLEGEPVTVDSLSGSDAVVVAVALAEFLRALQQIDVSDGPPPGPEAGWRGGPVSRYDAETRSAVRALGGQVDHGRALEVWDAALAAPRAGPPVWFHGDVAGSNLLVSDGRLSAVIDFGCCGVGDPACDLTIAWTLFEGRAREAFRAAVALDDATWARARGWGLWKALITVVECRAADPTRADDALRVVRDIVGRPLS